MVLNFMSRGKRNIYENISRKTKLNVRQVLTYVDSLSIDEASLLQVIYLNCCPTAFFLISFDND